MSPATGAAPGRTQKSGTPQPDPLRSGMAGGDTKRPSNIIGPQ